MKKILIICISIIILKTVIFEQVKLESYMPKILTLNSDGHNDVLHIKYENLEGENITLRVYDIQGVLVDERKLTGSQDERSEGSIYIYRYNPRLSHLNDKLQPGIYIFTLTTENKIIGKGTFIIAK
ncbi:MAG: gliding motility-associated C-terminal domain-containing protein [Endomicrobia bacterium]|nr:gliding motility-associated C-terminal domain-containing protein [Endomicrobiia bacterium]MCX7940764.1 gliding motility-associated C-terminal domain-containing protein [Endomicrobiia bacterium]MDW8055592.1 gliding motility-associated C-terminal domain-containing protein [Elusimicrobiota bacterium]